jgi:hypothetical protein
VLVASKIAGPGHGWFTPPVRDGVYGGLDQKLVGVEGAEAIREIIS